MERNEFGILVAVLKSNYTNLAIQNQESFDLWFEMLKDIDYPIANKAVKSIIMRSTYPPTIADIRKAALEVTGVNQLTTDECLRLVNRSISKYGRNGADKAMAWIKEQDEATYNVVKAIGFTNICNADMNFTRNTIMKMHKELATKENNNLLLTDDIKGEIKQIRNNGLKLISAMD